MRAPRFLFALLLCLFSFSSPAVAAALEVVGTLPQGEVRDLTQITVRFSENMRPLGVMEEGEDASPLKLSVPGGTLPAGNFRWQDPATLSYLFDAPVQGPYRFDVLVPAGTKALSGNALAADKHWTVNTPPIEIKHSVRGGVLPPKGGELYLTSNHALRLDDLTAKTRLMLDGKSLPLAVEEEKPHVRPGQRPQSWRYLVKVLADLPPGKDPVLALEAGIKPVTGSVPAGAFSFALRGYRPLQVKEWRSYPEKDKGGKAAPEEPLYLQFSNPVRYRDLLDHLSVSPAVPELEQARREADSKSEENDAGYSGPSTSHSLAFSWAPRTTYTVTLRPGLQDAYGSSLARESRHTFTTGDYRPLFSLPHGRVLEAATGGLLPLTLRNCSPVGIRLRFLPWGDNPARAFASSGASSGAGSRSGSMEATSQNIPGETEKTLHLDFSKQPNTNIRHELKLQDLAGHAGGGLFALRVTAPRQGWKREPGTETYTRAFQITDLGLTVKMGRESGLAWVTGLSDGRAVAGAELSLYGEKTGKLWQGTTDDAGLASLPGRDKLPVKETLYLKAAKGKDAYVQALDAGSSDLSDHNALPDADKPWSAHVLAQLPLYQPGQTVRFTLHTRVFTDKREDGGRDAGAWRPIPDGELVSYRVKTARDQEVHRGKGPVNAYGSLAASFALPQEAELGPYSVTMKRAGSGREVRVQGFSVASFRPPDFKVDVASPSSQALPVGGASPLTAFVSAAYFSGASLAGAQAALQVTGRETAFAPPRLSGYAVGDGGQGYGRLYGHHPGLPWRYEPPKELARLNAALDASGKAAFTLPPVAVKPGQPRNVSLEATVTDQSGLTSQGAASFMLHPSRAYVGLKAPFLATLNKAVSLDIKAAAFDDTPLTGVRVTLRAERRKKDGSGYEAPDWETAHPLTKAEGERVAFTPQKSGLFRISALIKDAEGRENLSTAHLYVPGPDLDWGGGGRGARLELLPDEELYAPGATARVVVKNPAARDGERYWALISLEREGVRETRVAGLSGSAPVLELPLAAKDAPYVYLSVVAVTGRSAPPPDLERPGADNGAPKALLATARLNVREKDTSLRAQVSTDAATYRPGGTVKATVTVRDSDGKPARTQVTLLAVDERYLRAAGDKTAYDPSASFSPLYSLGVRTQDSRRYLADLNLINLRRMLQPAAAKLMEAASPSQADSFMAPGGGREESPRENFAPDVFWLAQRETNDDGTLTVSFTLPDTLTSHRIVAVAADKGGRFATAATSVKVFKPLQLLSALPRFATEGDTLRARVLAQNLGTTDGEVTLTAEASGLSLENKQPQRIRLKAGSSATASFRVSAPAPGTAELRVRAVMIAAGQREEDAARFTLPVIPAAPLTTVAAAGLLKEGAAFSLPVQPPAPLDGRSKLTVIFAPSPAAGLPLAAQSVLDYPWHCLEQRLSRVWVRALRLNKGELLGLQPGPDDKERVLEVIASVPRFQKPDGGFALWQELRESDLYLTAYVLLVNSQTKELGAALPPEVERRALKYLAAALDKQPAHEPDVQAVALWVLSRDSASAQDALRLFPLVRERVTAQSNGADPLGLAALLLAAHSLPNLADREKILSELIATLEKNAAVTATQLHFAARSPARWWQSMGSTLRDNGLALWALTAARPDYPRLEALAFWLSQGLGEKKVLSTQEAMFGLAGLSAYLEQLGGNRLVSLKAVWNGQESVTKNFTRLIDAPQRWVLPASALPAGKPSGLELNALAGNPYWTARLVYASPSLPVRPENAGFTLTRAWSKPGPYRMGDTVDVTLTLTVPATRRHVMVFDPFPAGLEPLHATRADLQAKDPGQRHPAPWQRRELRDTGLLLYAGRMDPGTYTCTYTLRAAAPGLFARSPAYAEEMYTPEVFGRTGDERVEVQE